MLLCFRLARNISTDGARYVFAHDFIMRNFEMHKSICVLFLYNDVQVAYAHGM